jgi:RNA polymerase sigma-70 factor (ECF subfamily)
MAIVYQSLTDWELISLLKEEDEKGFAEIYQCYHSLLYIYAHKKLLNKQEAQDIIQDVLITLWNKRFELVLHASLSSYLFTAVRNRAFDLFSHKKVETKYITSLKNFIEDAGVYTDYLIRENDLKALIEKEIQALPPRMQEAFRLSRKEQLTHKEIANLMAYRSRLCQLR